MTYAVGIDVGGTNTRVALINKQYEIIKRKQFLTNPSDPEVTLNQIKEVIVDFECKVEGIGISCPGPLDLINGVILTPPNLPGWHNYHLTERLQEKTGIKVYLENDANLAGLAESVLGAGKDKDYVQFLTVSTGIGAGFCIHDRIYRGGKGFAQEIANSILWKNGPSQGNLKKGSIESIASGTAITKRAKDAGMNVKHAGHVYELAMKGNEAAAQIMEDAYEYLSSFLGILYGILDPEIFVLGGSVALKIPGFIEEIQKRTQEKVYTALKGNIKVVPAVLGEDCGLIGAACLAFGIGAEN
jgi:glucokinase